MSLKTIIWTIAIAVIVFFTAIYFGIKYDWVNGAEPKLSSSTNIKQTNTIGSVNTEKPTPLTLDKHEKVPELIDEPAEDAQPPISLGSLDLTIEDIVAQCQSLTQSVGIPDAQVEQAMMECINRNSTHLTNSEPSGNVKLETIRADCDSAITQRELLSQEEIKMLLDECIASSQ